MSSEAVGELTAAQRDAIRQKRHVVPMLATITVVFGVCWLPYHVYFLITYHKPEITQVIVGKLFDSVPTANDRLTV